jgi:acetyl-CoA carboxylase beta subunit
MHRPHEFDGSHWDTARIRRAREFGWAHQNDARQIEAARRERLEAEEKDRAARMEETRQLHWKKCPRCGSDMTTRTLERMDVEECSACKGIYLASGVLDRLLSHPQHDLRGVFRKLLGFHEE